VSGSKDNTLRVWNLETGECLRELKGHTAGVTCVSLTADGRRAVSGSEDHTMRVWDLQNGAYLGVFVSAAPIGQVAILSGRRIIGTSAGQVVLLEMHNLSSGPDVATDTSDARHGASPGGGLNCSHQGEDAKDKWERGVKVSRLAGASLWLAAALAAACLAAYGILSFFSGRALEWGRWAAAWEEFFGGFGLVIALLLATVAFDVVLSVRWAFRLRGMGASWTVALGPFAGFVSAVGVVLAINYSKWLVQSLPLSVAAVALAWRLATRPFRKWRDRNGISTRTFNGLLSSLFDAGTRSGFRRS
jgi:hypothetical protein